MQKRKNKASLFLMATAYLASAVAPLPAMASSHREAPFVTEHPKVDGTDFYMFRSYEQGRQDYVTIIANYNPLQDAYGGPNYFTMDPDARYDIKIDNTGDGVEDITFRFKFTNLLRDIKVPAGGGVSTSIPLIQAGQITAADQSKLNVIEAYNVSVIKRQNFSRLFPVTNLANGSPVFIKPADYIGTKTFPDYASYASSYLYNVRVPDCAFPARMFVGQRQEGFSVNLGEIFDLVNFNPIGAPNSRNNTIKQKNITTLALEIPTACLVKAPNTTIGAWTTSSLPVNSRLIQRPTYGRPEIFGGGQVQVSRLANPLVNEVVIGLKDKDRFNNSSPRDDSQFASYVTNPSLPILLQTLFPIVTAPSTPRNDLLSVFVTGVDGLNKFGFGEMMRLNTALPFKVKGQQNTLGVIAGDTAGYPNGRRPGDDVVDISLRVVMGKLLPANLAPSGQAPFTDGAAISDANFPASFPYLNTPVPGSPDQN